MPREFDPHSRLWPAPDGRFFPDLTIRHRRQVGGSCVSTCLSLLSGEDPELIRHQVNTQDPVSWSAYLRPYGMKLAYCPTDLRRLKHYVPELLALDDLFAIGTYSPEEPREIGAEPDDEGWICSSHLVLLHRGTVHDTRFEQPCELVRYRDRNRYVKRLFRVVPAGSARGI